ncbi:MAG TPA: saccharopine dehydrogenase NADP-binding domain-containing protein [Nitrososphaerales archaeon]|nr:saccharopine dehydrogenase NADP-binding domain-containing protein [Nitrososphaerales archaeon]
MKTLVLGASGQIGAYAAQDLVEFSKAEVIASSRKLGNVKKAMDDLHLGKHVHVMELDASDTDAIARVAKSERVDTVVNCAWYQTNIAVMKACLRAGAHYTDLGGFFDTCLKQLEFHRDWKKAGINATIGLGSTPGLTNVAGAAGAAKLDKVETINIYCSWGNTLEVKEPGWPGYSIRTVLDEFTQEPVMWLDGKHVKQPVLSGETTVTMQEPIGKVTAYYVKHSEPATLGRYVGKGCRNVTFRIGFPSTDFATFRTLRSLGFADTEGIQFGDQKISPLDYLTTMYQRAIAKSRHDAPPKEEYEYDAFRIDVFGARKGTPATVTYHIITWNDPERGIPSARDTSVPPAVVSYWQGIGKIKEPGVFPAEATVDPEPFFVEMGKRKIRVEEHSTETKKFY